MGQGDQYMKPKFSVGMGLSKPIPGPSTPVGPVTVCPVCDANAPTHRSHVRKGDEQATSKRICFGLSR